MINEKMLEYLMLCKIIERGLFIESDSLLEMKDRKEKLEKEFIKEYKKG